MEADPKEKEKVLEEKLQESNPYLYLLYSHSIPPNFWCSIEYFEKGYAQTFSKNGWYGIVMDGFLLAPPARHDVGIYPPCSGYELSVWSDLLDFEPRGWKKKFLDYEFIYNPAYFLNLQGKKWSTFRKNIRKFQTSHPGCIYKGISELSQAHIIDTLSDWLSAKEEEIHDDEIMIRYLLEGNNRRGVFSKDGELLAINVWDENYKYINYRYCVCKPIPFLSEYARYRFYVDPFIISKGKLVNDGGVLDKESLYFFKKRLNPISIRKVYSWSVL